MRQRELGFAQCIRSLSHKHPLTQHRITAGVPTLKTGCPVRPQGEISIQHISIPRQQGDVDQPGLA